MNRTDVVRPGPKRKTMNYTFRSTRFNISKFSSYRAQNTWRLNCINRPVKVAQRNKLYALGTTLTTHTHSVGKMQSVFSLSCSLEKIKETREITLLPLCASPPVCASVCLCLSIYLCRILISVRMLMRSPCHLGVCPPFQFLLGSCLRVSVPSPQFFFRSYAIRFISRRLMRLLCCLSMLQAGRLRFRFPMRSLDFSVELTLSAAL
jgi:hypothetical protein